MSAEAHAGVSSDEVRGILDELDTLNGQHKQVMRECLRKIEEGRIRDAKKEQARVKWVNAWVRVAKERRQVLEAKETWEVAEELEELKQSHTA